MTLEKMGLPTVNLDSIHHHVSASPTLLTINGSIDPAQRPFLAARDMEHSQAQGVLPSPR
jgi:hypothetical protein